MITIYLKFDSCSSVAADKVDTSRPLNNESFYGTNGPDIVKGIDIVMVIG
jgi:hypothetical protein